MVKNPPINEIGMSMIPRSGRPPGEGNGTPSMGFPGTNTGMGCHFLLWGIFPAQRSNPYLFMSPAGSLPLAPPGKPQTKSKTPYFHKKPSINRGALLSLFSPHPQVEHPAQDFYRNTSLVPRVSRTLAESIVRLIPSEMLRPGTEETS